MQVIATLDDQTFNPDAPSVDRSSFRHRKAARAVVLDSNGRTALLYARKRSYHKLPGGGVEENEDIQQALTRELQEEIGCTATIAISLGTTIEHRDQYRMTQTSHCFLAQQTGEKGQPDFTDEENADGFEVVWAKNVGHAIELLQNDISDFYDVKFMHERDLQILKSVKQPM